MTRWDLRKKRRRESRGRVGPVHLWVLGVWRGSDAQRGPLTKVGSVGAERQFCGSNDWKGTLPVYPLTLWGSGKPVGVPCLNPYSPLPFQSEGTVKGLVRMESDLGGLEGKAARDSPACSGPGQPDEVPGLKFQPQGPFWVNGSWARAPHLRPLLAM